MAHVSTDSLLDSYVRSERSSAQLALEEHCNALVAEGRSVFRLGVGQSPFPVPPSIVAALRAHAEDKSYAPARGLYELRRAVAHYAERTVGIDRTLEDVLVGPGVKALAFLLRLAYSGEIVGPTPGWPPHSAHSLLLGRSIIALPTKRKEGWMLTAEGLEAFCARAPNHPRIVTLGYPGNPTGTTYKVEQLKALARVAREHEVILLSDEVYGELHHKGQHVSVARYFPEGTIIATGLSKWCGAEGWRLGAYIFPERLHWLLDAMALLAGEIFTATSTPVQYAAAQAFEGSPELESYLHGVRRILSALGRWCARQLRGAGLHCAQPTGGFYLYPDFGPLRERLAGRGISTAGQLCTAILEATGVALLPGSAFGSEPSELTARLAYVDFEGARALEAVDVIPLEQPLDATFLKRHCRRVHDATLALVAWLAQP